MTDEKLNLPLPSVFSIGNIRYFIAFRIFFNARFYYPVFTILFLDLGLSVAQFAMLNVVWAGTIVLLEVPSGAFADVMGRKRLIVITGVLMIIEMGLLCFAPRNAPVLLFFVCMVNRILSGMAEASASGADEAIAFDTLKALGREKEWPKVLDMQMRMQSIAFVAAMSIGALLYDPVMMGRIFKFLHIPIELNQNITLRFPLFLTWITAFITLFIALKIKEPEKNNGDAPPLPKGIKGIKKAFALTFKAGGWILNTPFALATILMGMVFDGIVRLVITLSSQYYRLIQIPESLYGLIGSSMAMIGIVIPRIALHMTYRYKPAQNLFILAGITLIGLFGMLFFQPLLGLIPAIILFSGMYMNGFFVSHYLNAITDSEQRATVLSFKGLSYNLSYGLAGLFYSMLLHFLRSEELKKDPAILKESLEGIIFKNSFLWIFASFIVMFLIFSWISKIRMRKNTIPLEGKSL